MIWKSGELCRIVRPENILFLRALLCMLLSTSNFTFLQKSAFVSGVLYCLSSTYMETVLCLVVWWSPHKSNFLYRPERGVEDLLLS